MPEDTTIQYQKQLPADALRDYVDCFWSVRNTAAAAKTFTILPDGYFDLLFRSAGQGTFTASVTGIYTQPVDCIVPGHALFYAVSFKLPALDDLLRMRIDTLVNREMVLPPHYWNITPATAPDFSSFTRLVTQNLLQVLQQAAPDNRRQALFRALYTSAGAVNIQQMSRATYWSSRQINRYFNSRTGISLKAYCNILRYRASFEQLQKGELYPGEAYFDQAHFIREVKKYSGATPRHLAANKNGRFIQLSTLRRK